MPRGSLGLETKNPGQVDEMLTDSVVVNCLLIFLARVIDVSLGTLRTLSVVQGNRSWTWILGFSEVMIWLWVVVHVLESVSETPVYGLFYGMGYATGGSVGMTIEKWLAFGERSVLLFTRQGYLIARALRKSGYVVTEWKGQGRDGPIDLLFLKVTRRMASSMIETAKAIDPDCYSVIENAESTSRPNLVLSPKIGWRPVAQKEK